MDRNRIISEQPSADKLRPMPVTLLWAGLIAATSLTVACGGKDPKAAGPKGPPAMPVKVETARSVAVNDTTEYVATLKSRDSAVLMPQVEGQITQIYVHSGDRVSSGAPLMQIDPAKQQSTVNSQEDTRAAQQANSKWARKQDDRIRSFCASGG